MEKVYLTDNIFYIENFLSDESHNNFIDMCKQYKKNFQSLGPSSLQRSRLSMPNSLPKNEQDSWEEINNKIKLIFNDEKQFLIPVRSIIKVNEYIDGDDEVFSFKEHYDDHGERTENNLNDFPEPVIFFGCVYYINDSYDGGFIMYPKSNVYIKPKANSLVCHSGYEPHMVTQIFNGEKYNIPCFIKNKKSL
jgi:hypothetical protein